MTTTPDPAGARPELKHPMQPVEWVGNVVRFKQNAIISWLLDSGKLNLNEIAAMNFSDEDRMQVAQLIGYSVSGFGDLSYVDGETLARADAAAYALPPPPESAR